MILLITGPSHTGKTALAQRLLEKYGFPYLSIDHLKMGLIRSRLIPLTPESPDEELTGYLWPVICGIVKTAIENCQNLIVEGCYIPADWQKYFSDPYLKNIKYLCLAMSREYIEKHFADIEKYADIIEKRLDDSWISVERLKRDNDKYINSCIAHGLNYLLIENDYPEDIDLGWFS